MGGNSGHSAQCGHALGATPDMYRPPGCRPW